MIERERSSVKAVDSLGKKRKKLRFDIVLFLTVILAASFGVLVVYSATRATLPGGVSDPVYYLKRQAIFFAVGLVLFIVVQFVNYRKMRIFWWLFFLTGIILLAATLIFGYEVHGSRSWIDLIIFPVQPSEFSKIFMVVTISAILSKWKGEKENRVTFKKVIISFLILALFVSLVLLQPDYGTALIYIIVFMGMLFISGANFIYFLSILAITTGGFFLALNMGLIRQYQLDRLLIFLRPGVSAEGAGYNLFQSKLAIGSGGFMGKGLFLGRQTNLSYVPEHHTDFIFSVIGEETGFIGGFLVIVILGIIIWRCFYIASNSANSFASLLASGIGFMILAQVVINIGMTIGLMPIIGIPLPFLSSGGSSLVSMFIGTALVENVYIWKETRKEYEIAYQDFR